MSILSCCDDNISVFRQTKGRSEQTNSLQITMNNIVRVKVHQPQCGVVYLNKVSDHIFEIKDCILTILTRSQS